jgi:serine/threonine protein kinase
MPVPDLIGRYRLGPRLGSGGFAVVWLAHDESLDTQIAIKVMAENWADRMDLRERFLREAQMLRRAASARIVQVFDIGELPDGRPYFVMEYADRGTLADRVRTEPMPLVTALRVTAEIARGAAELHRAGIVHRDLKPSNVLIRSTADGPERLLIADLGVAKNLAQASAVTMSVGSAGYMAPEQSGPNSGVDVRADVYSLGAIAYRLITGKVPGLPGFVHWDGPDAGVPMPLPVRRVLQRALEVDRERRWPDAPTLAAELDRLAAQFSAPPPRPRRGGRWALATLAVLTVLAVLGGIGFGVFQSRRPVRVQDASHQISVEVPRVWGRELIPTAWNPGVLKLAGSSSPGLLVADHVRRWNDLGQDANGVFVGLSDDPQLTARVTSIQHPGCRSRPSAPYDSAAWKGQIRRWDGCDGDGRSVQEISLVRTGDRPSQVYVQIRQSGADDVTRQILESLQITD